MVEQNLKEHPNWGAWMPACTYHVFTGGSIFTSDKWEVPMNSGITT